MKRTAPTPSWSARASAASPRPPSSPPTGSACWCSSSTTPSAAPPSPSGTTTTPTASTWACTRSASATPAGGSAPCSPRWASRSGSRGPSRPRPTPYAGACASCATWRAGSGRRAGLSGAYAAPPSTAPVALHAGLLDHLLTSGAWSPHGGGQVLPEALAEVVTARGGELRTGVRVDRVLVEGARAVGVTLVDGTELRADAVVSSSDPKRTFLGLVGRLPASTLWVHDGPVPVRMTSASLLDPDGGHAPAGHSTLTL